MYLILKQMSAISLWIAILPNLMEPLPRNLTCTFFIFPGNATNT